MLTRRDLLFSGTLASSLRADDGAQRAAQDSSDAVETGLRTLTDAVRQLHRATASTELTDIREKQRVFFKANQKFPEFIDIGVRVWEHLYDWHIENQLPLKTSRTADGRLEMEVLSTVAVLKWELAENQIGEPY